ncbi:MAG: hypothetical protein J5777_06910 [Clostridiales bacterium]|nr:hypothetical protein [Clostridiales bacterium]
MQIATISVLYVLNRILMIAASFGILVLGVLVLVNKVKQTKILGVNFIILGLSSVFSCFLTATRTFMGIVVYAKLSQVYNIFTILTNFAIMFCICWYIHKTYGKKYIYIPVFAMEIIGRIANTIVAMSLNKVLSGAQSAYWITLVMNINNFITGTVTAVILFLAFYKNRDKETIIPATWKIRIILYAFNALQLLYTISAYCVMIKVAKDHSYNPGGILGVAFGVSSSYYIVILFELTGVLVNLIFPIYVFVKLKKAGNKEIPQQTA